jgi:nicotinamide-nucleotide amidase
MNAEILCVGTELLLGDIVNTNAAYIAKGLAACGVNCFHQSVVGDNPARLESCLTIALSRSEIVIMTGGLGPTYDDLTKEPVAKHFGLPMELHEGSMRDLTEIFAHMGREMTENNKKQAYMPQGATVLHNDRGTANGLMVEQDGKRVFLLPGPPREMTAMFTGSVVPILRSLAGDTLVSKVIHFFGIGESALEAQLKDYMLAHENPTIAPYAKEGEVVLRITAKSTDGVSAEALLAPVVDEICAMFPNYIYGIDVGSLQGALVQRLTDTGLTIATAESCTGGLVGKRITEIDGSSKVYVGGVVTYSNNLKMSLLGVKEETLMQYGAVSEQTAVEMAAGVRRLSKADIGVSITGVAGAGSEGKPTGLVYIAVTTNKDTQSKELHLSRGYGGERELIRYLAASHALHMALNVIPGRLGTLTL